MNPYPFVGKLGKGTRGRSYPLVVGRMKLNENLKRFEKYLNGNPAMLEIWTDAIDRIEKGIPLAPVQVGIVREWLSRAAARKNKLELEAELNPLSLEKETELISLRDFIEEVKGFKEE